MIRFTGRRGKVGAIAATAALALATMTLGTSSALADTYNTGTYYDNDYHGVLPGTNNWYETGFSSTLNYDATWGNNATFTSVSSWADTGGGYVPNSIQLTDTFQADGIGASCSLGFPSGASCTASGTQVNIVKSSTSSGTTAVDHGYSAVQLGGTVISWVGEYAAGTFTVGSSTYEADASYGEGWAG